MYAVYVYAKAQGNDDLIVGRASKLWAKRTPAFHTQIRSRASARLEL